MKKEFILAPSVKVREQLEKVSEMGRLNIYVNLVYLGFRLTEGLN